ncbi:hypothetical protein [Micromonospora globispora]|uniref:hypothetical protein n=1 Tax=Micromonospora globispora TaxID=1450148 RepID=UPI000F4D85AB|nr:hypothetical protein [Micromonospora globispora]
MMGAPAAHVLDPRQIRSYQLRIEPSLAERIADGQLTSPRQEDPDWRTPRLRAYHADSALAAQAHLEDEVRKTVGPVRQDERINAA